MSLNEKAYYLIIGLFSFIIVTAQDQRIADSLVIIYQQDRLEGIEKLELLKNLAFNELSDTKLSLKYSEELISLSKVYENNEYLYYGYFHKGDYLKQIGSLDLALSTFFKQIRNRQAC